MDKVMEKINSSKIKVINNPVILQNLCIIRDKNTESSQVRTAARRITGILLYEASKTLPLVKKTVTTPLASFKTETIDSEINIIISPILRAGLIFTDAAADILPQACIRHIGMYRDEKTLKPVWYYNKIPMKIQDAGKYHIFITDVMLATGNSIIEAIKLYADKPIPLNNIKVICLIAAPEGLSNVQSKFPEIEIITAAIDSHLNKNGYIVPGMGDAGDRIFNT